jgi:hypothetical protein
MRSAHGSAAALNIVRCGICTILASDKGRIEQEKGNTMFGYVSKIASKLRAPSIEERETAYLNQSVDRVDLEYRQRQIDRGMFRQRSAGIF